MAKGFAPKLNLELNSEDGAYALLKTIPELAKQNLKMIILTSPGERIFEPSFGVGIRRFLFEQSITGVEQKAKHLGELGDILSQSVQVLRWQDPRYFCVNMLGRHHKV